MPATKTRLIGGAFQDSEGNLLVNGYLEFVLSQDASVTSVGNIAAGITIRIQLDSVGNVAGSASTPPVADQFIWGNDNLSPVNTFYKITGYRENGQIAWGPNNQQVVGSSPFDIGTWVPNQVFSWTPPASNPGILLETNGTPNSTQKKLDITGDNGITASEAGGTVTIHGNGSTAAPSAIRYVVPDLVTPNNFFEVPTNFMSPQTEGVGTLTIIVVPATSTVATYLKVSTANTATFEGMCSGGFQGLNLSQNKVIKINAAYFANTTVRNWVGLFDGLDGNTGDLAAPFPIFNMVAFRFDTSVGDTHWQAICQTDATHHTVVDTGIVPDVSGALHTFEFRMAQGVPGTVNFFIDGTQVASINTNVPASTTFFNYVAYVETLASVVRSVGFNLASFEFFQ